MMPVAGRHCYWTKLLYSQTCNASILIQDYTASIIIKELKEVFYTISLSLIHFTKGKEICTNL